MCMDYHSCGCTIQQLDKLGVLHCPLTTSYCTVGRFVFFVSASDGMSGLRKIRGVYVGDMRTTPIGRGIHILG
jgi:hypothetical protein